MSPTNPIRREAHTPPAPIPFPQDGHAAHSSGSHGHSGRKTTGRNSTLPESMDEILAAFDDMSRRITDLARELNCLGHFDDPNNDLPRAA